MNESWGLTEYGFNRPSYNDLLDAFEVKAKELFGSTINLTSRSPLGIFLRIFAWFANMLWELAEDVYNSAFLDTAVGVSLARLGAFIGIRLLAAQKATGTLTITGDAGTTVYAGFIVQATNNQRFVTLEDATIGSGGTVDIAIQAYETGPDGNVEADTITIVVTPTGNAISVTNATATTGGRDRETSEEFRERYAESVDKPGGSNTDSIRAELLETSGVVAAKVFENDTDAADDDGLPAHGIEAVVYGGYDSAVAAAIHTRKSAGIQTYGSSSASVVDTSGATRTIRFSRPSVTPIYVKITDLVTDDEFPATGSADIVQAVIDFIGSDTSGDISSGLDIGKSVYFKRLTAVVSVITGVVDFSMTIGTDGTTYGTGNISIGTREKAVTGSDKVVIT